MDSTACNYDELATLPASCGYAEYAYVDGACLTDEDQDGVCDELKSWDVRRNACNWSAANTEEDGMCLRELRHRCNGNCLVDTDGDGICEDLKSLGVRTQRLASLATGRQLVVATEGTTVRSIHFRLEREWHLRLVGRTVWLFRSECCGEGTT